MLKKLMYVFCFIVWITDGTFAQNFIPDSEIDYPGASVSIPFIAMEPYVVNAKGASLTVKLWGSPRKFDYSGNVPFINPVTGKPDLATIQAWSGGKSVNMTPTDETGLPGRVDKQTFDGVPVTMVRYNKGDGITEGKCRTQLNSWMNPGRTHTRWELEVAFGKEDGVNDWTLTPTGTSPVIVWQMHSMTQGNPPLAIVVDTDSGDPAKLMINFMQRTGAATYPHSIGKVTGISRNTMVSMVVDAFLDERDNSMGGKGVLQFWVNNKLIVDKIGPTRDAAGGENLWSLNTYLFNEANPYPYTRSTFWKTARMFVYPSGTDISLPTAPTGLSSANITSDSFTLNWAASTDNVGVTGYEVFMDGVSIGTTTTATMNVSGLTPTTPYSLTVKARDAAGNWSASSSPLIIVTTLDLSCKTSSADWQGFPIANQTGTFTTTFDVTPSGAAANLIIGLSNGAATAYSGMGPIIAFQDVNTIEARNGGAYAALTSIPYTPGTLYHFRLVINVANHTYSAYVTPKGGSELTIGTDYAFRTEQATISNFNYWNLIASGGLGDAVCNFNILDTSAPTAPTGLSHTNITPGSFTLNWAASTDNVSVTGYEVFMGGVSIGTTTATTINVSDLVASTPYSMTVKARDAAGNWSAASAASIVTTLNASCKMSTVAWQGWSIANQTGSFTTTFDVTPAGAVADIIIGFSNGAATAYSSLGPIIAFQDANTIQARNGGGYTAETTIPYVAGTLYHFRLVINVATHTYSAYVTPQGGNELTIGTDYAFRTDQATVSSLNYWNLIASGGLGDAVCNFSIPGVTQVPEIENTDFAKLYPNPANSMITLELSSVKKNEKVQIYNILGELVKEVNVSAQRQQIDIESLVAGIYIVRLTQSPDLFIKFSKQ